MVKLDINSVEVHPQLSHNSVISGVHPVGRVRWFTLALNYGSSRRPQSLRIPLEKDIFVMFKRSYSPIRLFSVEFPPERLDFPGLPNMELMFKKKPKYENYSVFPGSVKNHQRVCGFYLSKNNLKTLDTPR
jgi:hypothetical protein